MSWLGANELIASGKRAVESVESKRDSLSYETDVDNTANRGQSTYYANNETVEAALNRLSKAYATAMECVGAMHKARDAISNIMSNEKLTQIEELPLFIRLARAARNLFENSILMDPLISTELAPTFCHTLTEMEDDNCEKYFRLNTTVDEIENLKVLSATRKRKRQPTIMLNSIGNKSTIQSIAYYSLVNYGDILVACTPASSNTSTILDRGVVKSLGVVDAANPIWKREILVGDHANNSAFSGQNDGSVLTNSVMRDRIDQNENTGEDVECKNQLDDTHKTFSVEKYTKRLCDETEDNVLRLALVAYIDATAIDGTDPTVWLKLACAARRLGQLQFHKSNNKNYSKLTDGLTLSELKVRRLERYALEMSIECVGPNEVPNRTAFRALQQINATPYFQCDYPTSVIRASKEFIVTVDLTKYSWLRLIRFVFNACKTGVTAKDISQGSSNEQLESRDTTTSPILVFTLPPLFGIPSSALQLLSSFLDQSDRSNLQQLCATIGLNVDVVKTNLIHSSSTVDNIGVQTIRTLGTAMTDPTDPQMATVTADLPLTEKEMKGSGSGRSSLTKRPASRVSSRVRSQMEASEKRAERRSRRQSIRYCLVAAVFGVSSDDERYQETAEDAIARDSATFAKLSICEMDSLRHDFDQQSNVKGSNGVTLARFFNVWKQNEVSSPISLLFFVLAHVSIHVSDVFPTDVSEAEALSTCVLESFELMSCRRGLKESLTFSWLDCNGKIPHATKLSQMHIFALDLLHAELRLKRCELDDDVDIDFDDDWAYLMAVVPFLYNMMANIEGDTLSSEDASWFALRARCTWLMASFSFWRSRMTSNTFEGREAEQDGLGYVDETMHNLKSPVLKPIDVVLTPHLVSRKRKELHWYQLSLKTLSSFSSEVQASSVVSQAREDFACFVDKCASFEGINFTSLVSIGVPLLERYKSSVDSPTSKFSELIEDFFARHGDAMLVESLQGFHNGDESCLSTWFESILLLDFERQSKVHELNPPSILSVLLSCLDNAVGPRKEVMLLLCRVVIVLVAQFEALPTVNNTFSLDNALHSPFGPTEYDSNIECDDLERDNSMTRRHKRTLKQRQYTMLIQLIIGKISSMYATLLPSFRRDFRKLPEVSSMLQKCTSLICKWFFQVGSISRDRTMHDDDFEICSSMNEFIKSLLVDDTEEESHMTEELKVHYVAGMLKILCIQRHLFVSFSKVKPNNQSRPNRVRITRRRAELVGLVSCDLGLLLSLHRFTWSDSSIKQSALLGKLSLQQVVSLVECILYFSRLAFTLDINDTNHLATYLDCFGRDRLRIPLATAVFGLCGSAVSSAQILLGSDGGKDEFNLAEFYDSDSSAVRLVSGNTNSHKADSINHSILNVVILSVRCIQNILNMLSDFEILGFCFIKGYVSPNGPTLPLVLSRVLNHFSTCLLLTFTKNDDNEGDVWSEEYPYGTQSVGATIDSILHKTYKFLHGFVLSSGLMTEPKDGIVNPSSSSHLKVKEFAPENAAAAALLFRCINRIFSLSRKSPPKIALECVLNALPPAVLTEKRIALSKLLYSNANDFSLKDVASIVKDSSELEHYFDEHEFISNLFCNGHDASDLECEQVRRKVAAMMAQGMLPQVQDTLDQKEIRDQSIHREEDFSKKFIAIVEDLLLNDIKNVQGWYKASQCLISKCEIITDRLGLTQGYCRSIHYFTPDKAPTLRHLLSIEDLLKKHECAFQLKSASWTDHLGSDLSHFVQNSWSSLTSLSQLLNTVKIQIELSLNEQHSGDVRESDLQIGIVQELEFLFSSSDFSRFQYSWGGLFVSSLRKVARRCLCMALYLVHKESNESDRSLFISEITESLGVMLYSELSCSQTYGFPIHTMLVHQKRELATAALACFQTSADSSVEGDDTKNGGRITWDIHFMQGKCYEKIAKTFSKENFAQGENCSRQYEVFMQKALQEYQFSVEEAILKEKEGGFAGEKDGGSNHGATEAIYRLHATRLKCLIVAVSHSTYREKAEIEALRLTEKHWFSNPVDDKVSGHRERIWNVFADIVSALARCRLDHSFFHRSIYRQAQALMWAPVLYDPVAGRLTGSRGKVPPHLACKLRGLNYATNAADSAVVVISSLFEKKRSQLCAVWVTESGAMSSIFQTLNNCVRKYDSLRGKYISAYVESLRVCHRAKELETFLRWTYGASRDLPDFFASSAGNMGERPRQSHAQVSLIANDKNVSTLHFLTSIKRITNSALASVISSDINEDYSCQRADVIDGKLKILYGCFLRLNCEPKLLLRSRKRDVLQGDGRHEVTEALISFYDKIGMKKPLLKSHTTDWSGRNYEEFKFVSIIEKCKTLYPGLIAGLYPTKKTAKPTRTDDSPTEKDMETPKRKIYSVTVPEGLKEGDTFATFVKRGDKKQKLRISVPAGNPTKIRFAVCNETMMEISIV